MYPLLNLGLPTIFHIFANNIAIAERSSAFGYLVAAGSVGQTVASVVNNYYSKFLFSNSMYIYIYTNNRTLIIRTTKLLCKCIYRYQLYRSYYEI